MECKDEELPYYLVFTTLVDAELRSKPVAGIGIKIHSKNVTTVEIQLSSTI
jgi:hypothetical protein